VITIGRGYVIASKRVSEDRQPVRYMYREAPDNGLDSGWRVFSGTEDQAYADVAANFAMYNASTILEIDPSIGPYLDAPSGTAFEREDVCGPFQQVPFQTPSEA
jgi:hypothetical protein